MSTPFNISFSHHFRYRLIPRVSSSLLFPALPIGLIGPRGQEDLLAIVDTGAAYSLFDGNRAAAIGLDLMSGIPIRLGGLAGSLLARLHRVTLEIFGSWFDCEVAFSEQQIERELLGRHQLFNMARFAFREGISLGYFHPEP